VVVSGNNRFIFHSPLGGASRGLQCNSVFANNVSVFAKNVTVFAENVFVFARRC
jgi:hypothetical protein